VSTKALAADIGRKGLLKVFPSSNSKLYIRVPIVVEDVKRAYGHTRYAVRPDSKRLDLGVAWVDGERVEIQR
jgi:hypothetical protein